MTHFNKRQWTTSQGGCPICRPGTLEGESAWKRRRLSAPVRLGAICGLALGWHSRQNRRGVWSAGETRLRVYKSAGRGGRDHDVVAPGATGTGGSRAVWMVFCASRVSGLARGLRVGLLACLLAAGQSALAASPEAAFGAHGGIASRSPLASEVGAEVLRRGGNAVDAAVATGFALAVTWPSAGNLGGGGFMVIRMADGTIAVNDHREKAPGAATRDLYLDENGQVIEGLSTDSHLAVGVPGSVDGLLAALEKYGTMSREQVVQPAIELAAKGFALPRDLAKGLAGRREQFARYPGSRAAFARPDGSPYETGDVFRQPDLAASLERIKREGRAGFYEGAVADLIVAEMRRGGGLITHEDLASYRSVWRAPVTGSYRGHKIISMPPPSSGGVLLVQMLNMLEPYDIGGMGFGSATVVHHMIEAERRAYADRAEYLGDPDFYPVPIAHLTSKEYARGRFADFNPERASRSTEIGAGAPAPAESPDTTHLSVIDNDGNAVAYTTTLNLGYGSKIVAEGTGILLNNEMDDFSAKPNTPNAFGLIGREANAIAPGKRMLSSMTPALVVKDGATMLATGSPGGSTIITTVFQVIVNVIDHGMAVSEAVGQPRFHHQWLPDRIVHEPLGLSPDTLSLLRAMGHGNLMAFPSGRWIGDANSVVRTEDGVFAMADPRNRGGAVGVNLPADE